MNDLRAFLVKNKALCYLEDIKAAPLFFLFFSITSIIEGRSVRSLTCGNTCVRAKENEWEGKKRSNWGAVSASESENLKSSKGSCALSEDLPVLC